MKFTERLGTMCFVTRVIFEAFTIGEEEEIKFSMLTRLCAFPRRLHEAVLLSLRVLRVARE